MSPEHEPRSDEALEGDWLSAVHEAGHAVVGTALGGKLRSITTVPPMAQLEFSPSISKRALLTAAVAGPVAERMLEGREPNDALDTSLSFFFDRLGDEDANSFLAGQLASAAEEDDVREVTQIIAAYSSRGQGLAQFRQARSNAIRILRERWEQIEDLARTMLDHEIPPS
jgi:hypothetical protein